MCQPQKMWNTLAQQIADELFEHVWAFCGVGAIYVSVKVLHICDALHNLFHLQNLKIVKNTHGGVLLLV